MSLDLLFDNLTNPALLFFFLGLIAVQLKSDLAIPETSSKFISMYLLFSIGFKGGQELSHSEVGPEAIAIIALGIGSAILIPTYTFFLLRKFLNIYDSSALAAAYGSVSAVTFITTVSFLEMEGMEFGGHMVATMAMMEAPSIVMGMLFLSIFAKGGQSMSMKKVVHHSLTNGSVLLILGSLIIGYVASDSQAEGIAPFTTDIFKGFLAVFLLDMGIVSGKNLSSCWKNGPFPIAFGILVPMVNGIAAALLSGVFTDNVGDRLLISVLAASASYIAVPAAMKLANPKASPGLYIPMALAITFPFNITIGIPLYLFFIQL
ncbi:sodium-dependent bicarbonate transport family permease [Phaeocystidibacter luteus]|uniref:Sodium-dependent bicarbonate transport family permease n=1 Tax=Phaeocystidibacter luteus TaxID=911197 RepID=A0A6N6RH07_9FLAO|nr:sodium-dependent bicarbonate transport family permease [Phaeocystidibacter luteus]KAB2810375.1 sodium-dependent bicarbonate transport family permease [Phaeocystidibacter luteus]